MALRTGDLIMNLFKRSSTWKDLEGEDLNRLKSVMASIVDDIVSVCDKYGLTYIMSYGTALGAIRHHGFIPWDDDLDISMPRKDYNRFLEVAEKELGDRYFIRCISKGDSIPVPTCHVKRKGTRYVNYGDLSILRNEPEETKCIYVDIFPLENCSDYPLIRKIDGYINLLLQFIMTCISVKNSLICLKELGVELTKKEKSALQFKLFLGRLFSFCSLTQWFKVYDRFSRKNQNHQSIYVTSLTGYKNLRKSTYLRKKVCNTTTAEFEGRTWKLPIDYDYYLKTLYGDYMVLPDSIHRKVHPVFELDFGE